MWPSIPLVVSQATVGTAMGLTTSIQMIGIGVSNLVVGQILGKNEGLNDEEILHRWKYVMIFLLANSLACVAATIFLNITDKKRGGILNISRKQRQQQELEKSIPESETKSDDEEEPLLGRQQHRIN
ncbi:uncharacterized protein LOC134264946 [Saccostrea cucullata]|uniref:uncharacterized protein LOC134264946 n=1 Tax=Saccostrea cuccullata TaxID=36930 RepID=UPI002ED5B15A